MVQVKKINLYQNVLLVLGQNNGDVTMMAAVVRMVGLWSSSGLKEHTGADKHAGGDGGDDGGDAGDDGDGGDNDIQFIQDYTRLESTSVHLTTQSN